MRKMLPGVAHCCQMTNPKAGTGSGGDRCEEAVTAIILSTYRVGIGANGADPEWVIYRITEKWNNGSDVSGLEPAQKIIDEVAAQSGGSITLQAIPANFDSVKGAIERGHIVVLGVGDYRQIRDWSGHNVYMWDPETQPAAGHATLNLGYDDNFQSAGQTLINMDPLTKLSEQPYDFSVASYQQANWNSAYEVNGPSLWPTHPAREYTVQPGESLWMIAARVDVYGDGLQWPRIYAANKEIIGPDPDIIQPGQVLSIPE